MIYRLHIWDGSESEQDPKKIWEADHPWIPQIGDTIQIDHNGYVVTKVIYDLQEDQITLMVLKEEIELEEDPDLGSYGHTGAMEDLRRRALGGLEDIEEGPRGGGEYHT